ncbi:hypothetical protein BHU72_02540 [Desulfuribacillus stibiiarsenatis]|uniref:DUF4227 domain-containing protein n=1 Tax=Desulfuribacillus stibiiarsenatis TaxID=1390249 RepID=A0A1E5L6A6_9FIRM|nr:DUF4227 family protein [Desulfuribacillus stibiiarsenatis]OEH85692.1 hypothetical protein BHU72_02540 [Desulfuribacillus stibiiarsenatis]
MFFVTFFTLTFVIYLVLNLTVGYIMPYDRYQEPYGRAVKVASHEDSTQPMERVLYHWKHFMIYGE